MLNAHEWMLAQVFLNGTFKGKRVVENNCVYKNLPTEVIQRIFQQFWYQKTYDRFPRTKIPGCPSCRWLELMYNHLEKASTDPSNTMADACRKIYEELNMDWKSLLSWKLEDFWDDVVLAKDMAANLKRLMEKSGIQVSRVERSPNDYFERDEYLERLSSHRRFLARSKH
jgi:hypothetical protein